MPLRDFLVCGAVLHGAEAAGRDAVLRALLQRLIQHGHIPADSVDATHAALLRRERLGSTGVGGGIAFPHTRHAALLAPVGALAVVTPALRDFDSLDGQAVNIVVLMLFPHIHGYLHQIEQALLRLRDEGFRQMLSAAGSDKELMDILHYFGG